MSAAIQNATVPPQLLLAHYLKALKLPTFSREYEKVAFECAQDQADYPRYLPLQHLNKTGTLKNKFVL